MPISNSPNLNKLGILLPQAYRGGSLRFTKKLAEMILRLKQDTEVVLSVTKDTYDVTSDFATLLSNPRFSVRETSWKEVSSEQLIDLGLIERPTDQVLPATYAYPADGGYDFLDCSAWFMVSDRTLTPLAPLRPYALFPLDFIQRYVPAIFGPMNGYLWNVHQHSMQRNLRNAKLVICTTPGTAADAVSFGGIPERKVRTMLPFLEDYAPELITSNSPLDKHLADFTNEPYMLWVTNPHPHKNHMAALDALKAYYSIYGGQLKCIISGIATQFLAADAAHYSEYADAVKNKISQLFSSDNRIMIAGELPEKQYWHVLRRAQFLWHNVISDNGTYSVVEAALANVPALSSDYPQNRFFDQLFDLKLSYFPAANPDKTAQALKEMEERCFKTSSGEKSKSLLSFPPNYHSSLDSDMLSIVDHLLVGSNPCQN